MNTCMDVGAGSASGKLGSAGRLAIGMSVLLAIAFLAVPVMAEQSEVQDREYRLVFEMARNDWGELNMVMEEEGVIAWSVDSVDDVEISMDLHSHPDESEVQYHEEFEGTTGESGTFMAPTDGIYSILVMNQQDDDATIEIEVDGSFGIHSLTNIDPLEESMMSNPQTETSPGPGLLLLVGAGLSFALLLGRRDR